MQPRAPASLASPKPVLALVLALSLAILVIPVGQGAFTNPVFGTGATSSTAGFKPILATTGNLFVAKWEGTQSSSLDDDVLYAVSTSNASTVPAGAIRLAKGPTASAPAVGLVVSSGDSDFAKPLENVVDGQPGSTTAYQNIATLARYLELDGVPGFTVGDGVYLDFGGTMENCATPAAGLSTCDVRLSTHSSPSVAAGTYTATGQADLVAAALVDGTLPDGTTFDTFSAVVGHYYDVNEGGTLDAGDSVYLRLTPTAGVAPPSSFVTSANSVAAVPVAVDLRIAAASGFGTMVAVGSTELVPITQALPTSRLVCTTSAGAACSNATGGGSATDRIILSWGNSGSVVKLGDLALSATSGMTFGAPISTTAAGLGGTLTASATGLAAAIYYIDLGPTGVFGEEDPVYLNRPADIGGANDTSKVSANDIRLFPAPGSSAASFAVGSVVGASDADFTSYSSGTGIVLGFVKVWDGDRGQPLGALRNLNNAKVTGADGVLHAADGAYVEATTAVANGATRLTALQFSKATTVEDGNPDINAGGAALTARPNLKISGDATFTDTDGVYIDVDSSNFVSPNDIRISVTGFAAGSTVQAADSDCTACGTTPSNPLTLPTGMTNGYLTGGDATFSAGEFAYFSNSGASTAVTAGMIRAQAVSVAVGTVSCSGTKDLDCGAAVQAFTNAKVTGSDGIWSSGSEWVYVSTDSVIGNGDLRVSATPFGVVGLAARSTVSTGDADAVVGTIGSGDSLYASKVDVAASVIPTYADVRLMPHGSLAAGTRVVEGNPDYSPRVLTLTQNEWCQHRASRGSDSLSDDAFYLSRGCGGTPLPVTGDGRLTPVSGFSFAAGSIVQSGDQDISAASNVRVDPAVTTFWASLLYWNPAGLSKAPARYDSGDALYMNNLISGSGSTIDQNDVRLKTFTSGTTFTAGTIVLNGHSDISQASGGATSADPGGGRVFVGKFLDKNHNGAYDAGEHLLVSADLAVCGTSCSGILKLGDVFLTGTGGPTSPASPPPPPSGGGSTATTTTTTTTTTSPTTTTTTTTSATTTSATTTTTSTQDEQATLASINQALASSLRVEPAPNGGNNLFWKTQAGAAGYQIWGSQSPFVLLYDVPATQKGAYHPEGRADTRYIVTAYLNDATKLVSSVVNGENGALIPGFTSTPSGEGPVASPGFIPGPGLGLLVLGLAALAVRRRRA